jgi:hypothetical protein
MNVLNKNLCVVLLCVFTVANAYASDSEVFSGFSLYGSLNHTSTTVSFDGDIEGDTYSFDGLGKQAITYGTEIMGLR